MIHYHGCPITPRSVMATLSGRFFCHSFARPDDVDFGHRIGQGNMLDNGAFSVWRQGIAVDWAAWWAWAEPWLEHHTTWAVLPDSIDGGSDENDRLLHEWGNSTGVIQGAPVWHLDEGLPRLVRLCDEWPRVCFGSSGAFSRIGTVGWHRRVSEAFDAIADRDGRVPVWIHMLRGMSLAGSRYPFASADSTDVAQNHNRPQNVALRMAERWDAMQCPARWERVDQLSIHEEDVA